ncbi:hypothetical protein [uncultured Duncaniella sp.]|uniref:hypothetical protein n=1 Tax=uncultured Duncaniella sp. TaxID=2768039 RepID=UPI0025AA2265|nr:hypothetical protein [uncultured Duncaniella sp.]
MTNNQIREIDCKCLNDYLATIPQSNHRFFVRKVVAECGNGIKQKTFYNWKAGYCRIPDFCKDIIEKIAGCRVFLRELYSEDENCIFTPRTPRTEAKPDTGKA